MEDFPDFSERGLLPGGDYELTLSELKHSLLVRNESRTNWDTAWREKLVSNLSIMVNQLWQVGIAEIFVDGSFVEDKDHPNDIDGYFECDLKELPTGRCFKESGAFRI